MLMQCGLSYGTWTERHKMAILQRRTFPFKFADAFYQLQYLMTFANRGDQAPAYSHLLQQSLWHFQSGRSQNDAIKRSRLG